MEKNSLLNEELIKIEKSIFSSNMSNEISSIVSEKKITIKKNLFEDVDFLRAVIFKNRSLNKLKNKIKKYEYYYDEAISKREKIYFLFEKFNKDKISFENNFKKAFLKFNEVEESFAAIKKKIIETNGDVISLIDFINDIQLLSSRTNFLSLNSAIESSFFESHKRSFFVISSGIKELSQKNYKTSLKMYKRYVGIKGRVVDSLNKSDFSLNLKSSFLYDNYKEYSNIENLILKSNDFSHSNIKFVKQQEEWNKRINKSFDSLKDNFRIMEDVEGFFLSFEMDKKNKLKNRVKKLRCIIDLFETETFEVRKVLIRNILIILFTMYILEKGSIEDYKSSLESCLIELEKKSSISEIAVLLEFNKIMQGLFSKKANLEDIESYILKIEK